MGIGQSFINLRSWTIQYHPNQAQAHILRCIFILSFGMFKAYFVFVVSIDCGSKNVGTIIHYQSAIIKTSLR